MSTRIQCTRHEGFTFLEVMVAVLVLMILMVPLIGAVQQNVARLAETRLELATLRLAEERLRQIADDARDGTLPETGRDEGTFEPPSDFYRWVLNVEPFTIELPAEFEEAAGSSTLFMRPDTDPEALQPSVLRVALQVLDEEQEEEDVDPLVIFVVEPADPEDLPEPPPDDLNQDDEEDE